MNRALALLRTSIGRKLLMALTGLGLVAFLIVHMVGNLYVLQGREALNAYAVWLKTHPLIWPARLGLLAVFALHVWLGISLALENRAARPVGYRRLDHPADTYASRSMIWTGLVALAFLIYHLAHFTFGLVLPEAYAQVDAQGRHDVYGMVVAGFRDPWILGIYVVAMLLLAVHLVHAGESFLQTLGIRYEHGNALVRGIGFALVAVIIVGNLSLPVLVFLGMAGSPEIAAPVAALAHGGAP